MYTAFNERIYFLNNRRFQCTTSVVRAYNGVRRCIDGRTPPLVAGSIRMCVCAKMDATTPPAAAKDGCLRPHGFPFPFRKSRYKDSDEDFWPITFYY